MSMKTTILALRDDESPDTEYGNSFVNAIKETNHPDLETVVIKFDDAHEERLPYIDSEKIIVMLYFPWCFRNRNIKNVKRRDGHYGGQLHKNLIDKYYLQVANNLEALYGDRIIYINPPKSICTTRDKKSIKKVLNDNSIPTPLMYETKSVEDVIEILEKNNLFIKFRVGGEGKGITYLTKKRWLTNIDWDKTYEKTPFVKTKINPFQSTVWEFRDVTDNTEFLEDLLRRFVIIEKEVDFSVIDKMKYDLRFYMIYGKPAFILPRLAPPDHIVTNWSRGGIVPSGEERKKFLNKIPKEAMKNAKKITSDVAQLLGLGLVGLDLMFTKEYDVRILEGQTDPSYTKQFDISKELAKATINELVNKEN